MTFFSWLTGRVRRVTAALEAPSRLYLEVYPEPLRLRALRAGARNI